MLAAGGGHAEIVQALLRAGAPWNALDRCDRCAGNYALDASHQSIVDALVEHAVRAELLLAAVEDEGLPAAAAAAAPPNHEYLSRAVRYEGDKLLDTADDAVMMEWERPLMEAHAERLCATKGDVLNVGFGMGIVDGAIAARAPRSHVIIEAHPEVLARMRRDGWYERAGVRVCEGAWQDVLPKLIAEGVQLDAAYFDTYGERDADMRAFHAALPKLLRPGGLYSFFNGLCPFNLFFQGVACQTVKVELEALGFAVAFEAVELGPLGDATWDGVRRRYFQADTYYLPHCVLGGGADDGDAEMGEDGGDGADARMFARRNAAALALMAASVQGDGSTAAGQRAVLREHVLPPLEEAGWALTAALDDAWAAASGGGVARLHAAIEAAAAAGSLDRSSAAVLRRVCTLAQAGPAPEVSELQLVVLPNPDAAASAAAGVGAATDAAGRDAAKREYASAGEFWERRGGSDEEWYARSTAHWAAVAADVSGMLGGLAELHAPDVRASLAFIDELRAGGGGEGGAGGGARRRRRCARRASRSTAGRGSAASRARCSSSASRPSSSSSRTPRSSRRRAARCRRRALAACHTVALQAFAPPAGRAYAVVWVQWTLNYLTDDDVAAFLRRAAAALEPGGAVVVKESVAREGRGFYADASEASITRTDAHFREIFERAGLAVAAAAPQPELPQAVFPVTMWALRAR